MKNNKFEEVFDHHEMVFNVYEKNKTTEMMKFCSNGDVYIKGEKVDNNQEIYDTFKKWLYSALDNTNLPQVVINNDKKKFE